jgi:anthranilate/para-aminobenzoate synthase component II
LKTLVIDNYDSFTYNLVHLLAEANQEEPFVVRNNELNWTSLARLNFDNIVISPGPGRPDRPTDLGISTDAIRRANVPILGVCKHSITIRSRAVPFSPCRSALARAVDRDCLDRGRHSHGIA